MVDNIENRKCSVQEKYKNIYGQIIHLHLMRKDNIVSVTLKKHSNVSLNYLFYAFAIITNLICYKLDFISFAPTSIIILIITICTYIQLGTITEETLLSIEPIGYQLNTKYIVGQKSVFLPYERVQNIFINEVIFKQKIIYLLTILCKGSTGDILIPLFIGAKPRIDCLEYIYRQLLKNKG